MIHLIQLRDILILTVVVIILCAIISWPVNGMFKYFDEKAVAEKFTYQSKVSIIKGFYKGHEGIVVSKWGSPVAGIHITVQLEDEQEPINIYVHNLILSKGEQNVR